jgi:hypothetical protein
MKNIFYVPIEPLDQRYTNQWYTGIPEEISQYRSELNIVTVPGTDVGTSLTPGAFLDFCGTNVYKSSQVISIAKMFANKTVKPGDTFLFADGWNPGIIQVKYMSELMNIPITIHCIMHAGAYDPTDILGFTIKDKTWVHEFERSIYYSCDYNWFGTISHRDKFVKNLKVSDGGAKAYFSGQPHKSILESSGIAEEKENIILFGHRISPDKQPAIFEDLAKEFPDYSFIFSQKLNLDKDSYYKLIRKAKISFSANLHENFGISMVEAVFNGTIPVVPNRLSYSEMYDFKYRYPSKWTESFELYEQHKPNLVAFIQNILDNYDQYALESQAEFLREKYMTAKEMIMKL